MVKEEDIKFVFSFKQRYIRRQNILRHKYKKIKDSHKYIVILNHQHDNPSRYKLVILNSIDFHKFYSTDDYIICGYFDTLMKEIPNSNEEFYEYFVKLHKEALKLTKLIKEKDESSIFKFKNSRSLNKKRNRTSDI